MVPTYTYYAVAIVVIIVVVGYVIYWRISQRGPVLPPMPPFGPLPVGQAATYLAGHLLVHSHLFPSETPMAWEGVRGWDVNEEPPGLAQPGPVTQSVLTDRLIHFCGVKGGRLACLFDFLLHMIIRVDFDPSGAAQIQGVPPGTGLATIHTPSGRTLLVCSRQFASALGQEVERAKIWAQQHGMDTMTSG